MFVYCFDNIRFGDRWDAVWVLRTEALPVRCYPIACFSLVASACTPTRTIFHQPRYDKDDLSDQRVGQRRLMSYRSSIYWCKKRPRLAPGLFLCAAFYLQMYIL